MSKEKPRNLAASVRQRLMNMARTRNEDFQLVLTRYDLECLLDRLSRSEHRKASVLTHGTEGRALSPVLLPALAVTQP